MRTLALVLILIASAAHGVTRYRFTSNNEPGVVPNVLGPWNQNNCTPLCSSSNFLMSPTAAGIAANVNATDAVTSAKPHLVFLRGGHTARLGSTTLSGTINLGLGVKEQLTGADFLTQIFLYVMKPDGTNRGTLYNGPIGILNTNTEWQTSGTHGSIMLGAAGTSTVTTVCAGGLSACDGGTTQTLLDGDRIVMELGFASQSDGRTGDFWTGTTTNDICASGYGFSCTPTCDTQDACIGFIEFSLTIPNAGTPTSTPTITGTPSRTATFTPTSTGTIPSPTRTPTFTPTQTFTNTPTPTVTNTSNGTPTQTPTFTRTPTASNFYGSNDDAAVHPAPQGSWNCDSTTWSLCRPSDPASDPDITVPIFTGVGPAWRRAVRDRRPVYEAFDMNKNDSTNPFHIEGLVLVSDPLETQSIGAGPAAINFPIYELHSYFNCTLSGMVWVRKPDGTNRCTIIPQTQVPIFATENSSNLSGVCAGAAVTPTPCAGVTAGDRLVGEIGGYYQTSGSNRDCYLYWANPMTDRGACGDGSDHSQQGGFFQLPGNILLQATPTFTPTSTGQPTGTPTRTPTTRPSCGPALPTDTPTIPPTPAPQGNAFLIVLPPSTPTVTPTPSPGGTPAAATTPFLCATTTPVSGNTGGYIGADALCAPAHICTPDEILHTIDSGTYPTSGVGWLVDGPSANIVISASDCNGLTTDSSTSYGRTWNFGANVTGGRAAQLTCDSTRPLLCCCN